MVGGLPARGGHGYFGVEMVNGAVNATSAVLLSIRSKYGVVRRTVVVQVHARLWRGRDRSRNISTAFAASNVPRGRRKRVAGMVPRATLALDRFPHARSHSKEFSQSKKFDGASPLAISP